MVESDGGLSELPSSFRSMTRATRSLPTYGFLRPPEADSELGRLAHYRVLKTLGQGGMGIVFEAEDTQLHRRVALKVIRPDAAADELARSRFLREARSAAALKNDHVVTIYQVGEDAGAMFLAMELLHGRSLESWLYPDRRATVAETLVIGRQMARGLAAAHEAGLIHRDIKPANLWLESPRARLKILDFGLARLNSDNQVRLTSDHELVGTPLYMPPEQLHGVEADHRSDLYSMGCVLYRMMTGALPFSGGSVAAVLHAVASQTATPVAEQNPNTPPRLASLIDRLLAKNPADRPATAQAVYDELQLIDKEWKHQAATDLANGETMIDPAIESPTPGHRRWWIAAATLLATGLGVAVWQPWSSGSAAKSPTGNAAQVAPADSAPIPQPPQPIDLLSMIRVPDDTISGPIELADGRVSAATTSDDLFQFRLPWNPPDEYRLRIALKRTRPDGGHLALGLSSGGHRCSVFIDHPDEDRLLIGISQGDPRTTLDRGQRLADRILPAEKTVVLECTVRPGEIELNADGEEKWSWQGDMSEVPRMPRGPTVPLFLGGSHRAAFEFSEITLEPLGTERGGPLEGLD